MLLKIVTHVRDRYRIFTDRFGQSAVLAEKSRGEADRFYECVAFKLLRHSLFNSMPDISGIL